MIRAKDKNAARMLGVPEKELPETLDREVTLHLSKTLAKKKVKHPEAIADYRRLGAQDFDFVDEENPEYGLKVRIVRFPIGDGKYENIVTNLPADEFDTDDIKEIYHLRWGVIPISE